MMSLRTVAVLGAGTMGSRIAAHFANAGYPVELLDVSDSAVRQGLDAARKSRPGAFFTDSAASLIRTGTFDENLPRITECEWIVEAVVEDLAAKRALLDRVQRFRRPGAILSTNTSGIPLARISEGWPAEPRAHFLGAHFFNPPRYLHLVEIVPGADTLPEVAAWVSAFCDRRLGKGVVPCKDTPNFIANRVGGFFGATAHRLAVAGDYTVEEADSLTGPLIGLPKSATFRLVDIVGLDVWAHVLDNVYVLAPGDPARDRFAMPAFMARMMERGWLGDKRGQGFYKRVGSAKEIHAIDWKTLEYHPAQKPRFESAEAAARISDLPVRLRALVAAEDRAGQFLWPLFRDLFAYVAGIAPEISPRIVEIDRALRWGFAFQLGPFELWDALGVAQTAERMARDGTPLPPPVERMLASGARSFYAAADRDGQPGTRYFDFGAHGEALDADAWRELEPRPGILSLAAIERARGVIETNPSASLIDIEDGVLSVEFHTRSNTLDDGVLSMIEAGLDRTARHGQALVIANQGEQFSAGASLAPILGAAEEGDWSRIDAMLRRLQQIHMAIKYAPRPVVAAPFGSTLGAGCELVLHAVHAQASAETYMGMVEFGVGLIPAAGGIKELALRLADPKRVLDLIVSAKISSSAENARELGLLRPRDGITMNPERLLGDAKAAALALAGSHTPGAPRLAIPVESTAADEFAAWREAGRISGYDCIVAEKLAWVLSGGGSPAGQTVSEQQLLDLEREAFLSLCGQPETRERIAHMLAAGKAKRLTDSVVGRTPISVYIRTFLA